MSSPTLSTKLCRIAAQAVDRTRVFTNLAHLIDVELLHEAYRRTRKDAAAGVDKVTGREYAENLESNLVDLHDRLRTGHYRAQPVRRVLIEKEDGRQRPLGIPAFEDKIVQRAVVMLLNPIYEQDFYGFSYAFRQGKQAHQALRVLREACMRFDGGTNVDADIRGFFDSLDRGILRDLVKRRVNDGGIHFLGYTHYWARSRWGRWVVKRKTMGKRLRRAMRAISVWCRRNHHRPVAEQHETLKRKLQGHYNYYSVRCNYKALAALYQHTREAWCKWLRRRSRKSKINWENFPERIEGPFPLPKPRIIHADV